AAGWKCIRCAHQHDVTNGYCLTVHHFDGNKSNCVWWNCLALCQRCHLSIQARVDPQQPYMLEHAEWLKPYVAGFYALKYLGMNCTRNEVMAQLMNFSHWSAWHDDRNQTRHVARRIRQNRGVEYLDADRRTALDDASGLEAAQSGNERGARDRHCDPF